MPTHILHKESLIPGKTSKLILHAPHIAQKAHPGHFVMLRMTPTGERIPLTIADTDAANGTITIVYLVLGKSTALLETLKEGDAILDVCGPLGHPTHIEKNDTVICVGGGTGIAAMHHIAKGHSRAGNRVVGIIGARSKDLLLFEKELSSFANELLISTDLAARGLDIEDVDYVIHLDLPEDVRTYRHRAGRTARAGKEGAVISLVDERELDKLKALAARMEIELTRLPRA